jgi:hypothetical protein
LNEGRSSDTEFGRRASPQVGSAAEMRTERQKGQGMAKRKIPNLIERRNLLAKNLDAKQAMALADAYLAEDRVVDALAFLTKAEASDRLEALAEQAIASGDAFLLKAALEAAKDDVHDRNRWVRLAEAAEAAGKSLYATVALHMANPVERS